MGLQTVATGSATLIGSPVAGVVTAVGGSVISSLESDIFGGSARDAERQGRVSWLQQAAVLGSVRAAQIIYAGPDNVAGDEAGYWTTAQAYLIANASAVWVAGQQAGKEWPTGSTFDMPNERNTISVQLAQLGKAPPSSPTNWITGGANGKVSGQATVVSPLRVAVGNAVQTLGAGLVTAAASGINPSGAYVTVPTSTNTIALWAIGGVLALVVLSGHFEHSK